VSWQEPIVAIIVGLAVVSLYRHLRELVGSAAPDAPASCHGCDDCADGTVIAGGAGSSPSPEHTNQLTTDAAARPSFAQILCSSNNLATGP